VEGLSADEIDTESISLIAPNEYGDYFYGACVDPVTNETQTSNNCSPAIKITVQDPATQSDLCIPVKNKDGGISLICL